MFVTTDERSSGASPLQVASSATVNGNLSLFLAFLYNDTRINQL
jgi:hypothetical protein